MHPILLRVGTHEIGTYGVLLVLALAVPLALVRRLAAQRGLSVAIATELAVVGIGAGILGSKALDAVVRIAQGTSVEVWRGAGAVHGGLFASVLVFLLRTRALKVDPAAYLVAFPPAIALGQALGRLGCFAAGCCFGAPGGLVPVQFTSDVAARLAGTPLGVPLHPVQLYDAASHALLAGALVVTALRAPPRGGYVVLGAWVLAEGILRSVLETWRGDLTRGSVAELPWLTTGRLTSGLLAVGGLVLLLASHRWASHRADRAPARTEDGLPEADDPPPSP